MAVFKCKMCGGALEVSGGDTVMVCEYCGTTQTLPRLENERKASLYDRANHFRRNNEFDKAMGIYEQILNEDNADAESYWSLVLCRYGIEYVEDPTTRKRIPTVNRAQFTSIYDDADYKSALQYATGGQRQVYEQEAAAINEIQKGILAISSQEEPFDVFICYKETDQNGRRTPDSVLATELYHELTREGFKVFFSRITLEDKLGSAYEPYIFAALNSAKVMVVIGTKPEHFNAVWVKNEWSRYLALIKSGKRKMLIPAYKGMDPYDLPEEFSHLQAQDMNKLGFMQDLIRGISKIIGADAPAPVVVQPAVVAADPMGANMDALVKRGFMALEDGEWSNANAFFEQALNQNAELGDAYLGKLMCELQVNKQEKLRDVALPFHNSVNYQRAIRFSDEKTKDMLVGCIQHINERNEKRRVESIYTQATRTMNTIVSGAAAESHYIKAAMLFETIPHHADAKDLAKKCREKAETARKDAILAAGKALMSGEVISRYEDAIIQLKKVSGWKDADERIAACREKIEKIKAERKRKEDELNALYKKAIRITKVVAPIAVGVLVAITLFVKLGVPAIRYQSATKAMESQEHETAYRKFNRLGAYRDAAEQASHNLYVLATQQMDAKEYEEASENFAFLGDYKSAPKLKKECNYRQAAVLAEKGNYLDALNKYQELGDYSDSADKASQLYRKFSSLLGAGVEQAVAIQNDGSVIFAGEDYDGTLSDWTNVVAVSSGFEYSVGVKKDGTVVYYGTLTDKVKTALDGWTDIVAISAGSEHVVGLKSDGTVVATGRNKEGQCKVTKWTDVVAISAGYDHTMALKSDGTVVAVGGDKYHNHGVVKEWTDVVAIAAGNQFSLGLKKDGTIVTVCVAEEYRDKMAEWEDVVNIAAGDNHIVGLKSDGTVVKTGSGDSSYVSSKENVIAVSAADKYTLYLHKDGTVSKSGYEYDVDVDDWINIGISK